LRDGIAVFQMDGDLLVKRLQKLPGSLINVISDNPRFAPFTLDFNDSSLDFKLIGRYRGRLSFA
jgi:phage repressor protein C with HTH and peptisase S24 domain